MLHLSTEFYFEFSEDATRTTKIYTRTSAKESTDYLKLIHRFGTMAHSTIYIIYLLIIQGGTKAGREPSLTVGLLPRYREVVLTAFKLELDPNKGGTNGVNKHFSW